MRPRRSTELGLLSLAAAIALSLLAFVMPYIWSAAIVGANVGQPLLNSLHTVWIPVSGFLLESGIVVFGLLGFAFVWRGRWEFGPENASRMGLTLLALVIAFAAYAAYALTGGILGYVSGVEFLRPWHALFQFTGAVFLGFALYWILSNLPLHGSRPTAAVSYALGVAGAALLLFATLGLRRAEALGVQGAGVGLSLASLVLWFVLCLWDVQGLRQRGTGLPAAAATRSS